MTSWKKIVLAIAVLLFCIFDAASQHQPRDRQRSSNKVSSNFAGARQAHRPPIQGKITTNQDNVNLKSKLNSPPERVRWDKMHPENEVVGFYNMYIKNPEVYPEIVNDQLNLMEMTGLLKKLDVVYYLTIGGAHEAIPDDIKMKFDRLYPLKNFRTTTSNSSSDRSTAGGTTSFSSSSLQTRKFSKFVHLAAKYDSMDETATLNYIYNFCQTHPKSKVLYFHNKGSFHYTSFNINFRQFLDCYVLNPHCLDAFEDDPSLDTCGWRFSVYPNPHYSGNYWWAQCSYINKLVHPASMVLNETFAFESSRLPKYLASNKRHFAEAWVGSYPVINAADCMGPKVDTSFLCCYRLNNISSAQCPNHIHNYEGDTYHERREKMLSRLGRLSGGKQGKIAIGSKCKLSSVITQGQLFSKAYDEVRGIQEHDCNCGDLVEALTKRSWLWYGQEPITAIKASQDLMNIQDVIKHIPKKAILRDRYDARVTFLYDQGKVYDNSSVPYQNVVKVIDIENNTISTQLPVFEANSYQIKEIRRISAKL